VPRSWANFDSATNRLVTNWHVDGARNVEWFDDFLGDTINLDMWTTAADTGCTALAVNVQAGGAGRMTTDTTDEDRVDAGGPVMFKPSDGAIYFECRMKSDVITTLACNAGMCDAATQASQVIAFEMATGTTFTTIPVDGVGWFADVDATTDKWRGIGVKANTDTAAVVGATFPVAATYDKLGIYISTAGAATFFLNGVKAGSVLNATTATTLLAPYIAVKNRGGAAHNTDVDYVKVIQFLNR
jgi:hypothetical protein